MAQVFSLAFFTEKELKKTFGGLFQSTTTPKRGGLNEP